MMRNNQLQIEADLLTSFPKMRLPVSGPGSSWRWTCDRNRKTSASGKKRCTGAAQARDEKSREDSSGKQYSHPAIILRHHADADGICSAVAIEQALLR